MEVVVTHHAAERFWQRRFCGRPLPCGGQFAFDEQASLGIDGCDHFYEREWLRNYIERLLRPLVTNDLEGRIVTSEDCEIFVDGGCFVIVLGDYDAVAVTYKLSRHQPQLRVSTQLWTFLGLDAEGFDERGCDINGRRRGELRSAPAAGEVLRGCDRSGWQPTGALREGFGVGGICGETSTRFDRAGYDQCGFDWYGFTKDGVHLTGTRYDLAGYDIDGFDRAGIHMTTSSRFNPRGYDCEGYDERGFNRDGVNRDGFDRTGRDTEGFDRNGFGADGTNRATGTEVDSDGYDRDGYDRDGYDRSGFNRWRRDAEGYDRQGYDQRGFDRNHRSRDGYLWGYDSEGYSRAGYNRSGYNRNGYDHTGLARDGYDRKGHDGSFIGYDRDGYSREGFSRDTVWRFDARRLPPMRRVHIHRDTGGIYDAEGYDFYGRNRAGKKRSKRGG